MKTLINKPRYELLAENIMAAETLPTPLPISRVTPADLPNHVRALAIRLVKEKNQATIEKLLMHFGNFRYSAGLKAMDQMHAKADNIWNGHPPPQCKGTDKCNIVDAGGMLNCTACTWDEYSNL